MNLFKYDSKLLLGILKTWVIRLFHSLLDIWYNLFVDLSRFMSLDFTRFLWTICWIISLSLQISFQFLLEILWKLEPNFIFIFLNTIFAGVNLWFFIFCIFMKLFWWNLFITIFFEFIIYQIFRTKKGLFWKYLFLLYWLILCYLRTIRFNLLVNILIFDSLLLS